MADFNPDDLDPGIRATVLWLRSQGFDTRDSGDGETKVGAVECALEVPHVAIVTTRDQLLDETDRLAGLVRELGVEVSPLGGDGVEIQAGYDPGDGSATILIMNFVLVPTSHAKA